MSDSSEEIFLKGLKIVEEALSLFSAFKSPEALALSHFLSAAHNYGSNIINAAQTTLDIIDPTKE